jgi:hypothetical protein
MAAKGYVATAATTTNTAVLVPWREIALRAVEIPTRAAPPTKIMN